MTGATGLEPGTLKGKILINLDAEEEGTIYIGCAGGLNATVSMPVTCVPVPEDFRAVKLEVGGLKGGHSGIDIILGRGNAIKICNRILYTLAGECDISISDMTAGSVRNAIPRDATATVLVKESCFEHFRKSLESLSQCIRGELDRADPQLSISIADCKRSPQMMSSQSFNSLTRVLYGCPNGVIRMSDRAPGVVETSNNIAMVRTGASSVVIECLLRSSLGSARKDLANMIESVISLSGASVRFSGEYPGWQPDPDSPIVKLMEKSYAALFGKKLAVKVIHGGLECGIIGAKYPGMELVACGPTIRFPHSPDEKLLIQAVPRFWSFLLEVLKRIPKDV
jgi:dipeptidase D